MCWEGGRLVFHQKGLLLLFLLFWKEDVLGFVSSSSSFSGGTELVVVVIVVVGGLGMSSVSRRCRIWSRARREVICRWHQVPMMKKGSAEIKTESSQLLPS